MSEITIHWCGPTMALVRRSPNSKYQTVGEHIATLTKCVSETEGEYWRLVAVGLEELYRGDKDEAIRKALDMH